MAYEFIQTELRDGVLIITMHDPPTRNALGPDMSREMNEELDRFEADPEQRVLLLTGTEPSFCSGANVRNFNRRIEERDQEAQEQPEPEPLPWGENGDPVCRPPGPGGRRRFPAFEAPRTPKTFHSRRQRTRDGRRHGRGLGLRHSHRRREGPVLRGVRAYGVDSRRRQLLDSCPGSLD